MTARDCNTEIGTIVDEELSSGEDIVTSVTAHKIYDRLLAEDPELLSEWLHHNARAFLSDMVGARIRGRRAHIRRTMSVRAFSDAADEAEGSGSYENLGVFRTRHVIDDKRTQRTVADMNGNDHLYVATGYGIEASNYKMLAAFHRAVARQIGDQTTKDVMTEETYLKMYASLIRDGS